MLNQRVAVFRRQYQALAKLVVGLELLFHQRICLNAGGFVRRYGLLGGFFRQGQAFAVYRLLQQLKLVFQAINIRGDVITLFLKRVLQHRIPFQAFTLLFDLRIEQGLLNQQQRLLRRAQRTLAYRRAVQTVADLLQLLRRGVHRVLHALGLGLQRNKLAVIRCKIRLRGLQVVEQLCDAGLQLT